MNALPIFNFLLYVADHAPNSTLAFANLTALCHQYLPDRHHIEVVDVFREPERALADRIILTPTLIKLDPFPAQTILGTLTDIEEVLLALGLDRRMNDEEGFHPTRRRRCQRDVAVHHVGKFIRHFIAGQSGWWECISPAEIDGPAGRIRVTPGLRFFPGSLFMGVDLARMLTAEYQRFAGINPARNGHEA